MKADDRYVVISADCHGGGEIHEYRDFLARRYHDEFDAWVDDYEIVFPDLLGDLGRRNWDSDRRLHDLEADGIAAEVIFPNTIPPFFPGGALVTQVPPADAHDLELRWAGLQAHNRWLADFCARTPGRRAGIAQILLHDVDASVEEIRWAHEHGLTGGILLPGAPPGTGLLPLHHKHYDPIWSVCEELGVPVNHHGGSAGPPRGSEQEDIVMFLLEVTWWSHNVLTNLIVGGALDRHPNLQFVFTEQGTAWVPDFLGSLDYFFDRMRNAVGSQEREWGLPIVEKMALQPSEYWARQCHIGASFIRPSEVPIREQVGVDRIMWGSDYPHKESSHPFSKDAIRLSFAGVDPIEVQMMLAGNAAALYGFDLDTLAPIGAKIGPVVGEVARPLSPADFPEGSQKCPAFADPALAVLRRSRREGGRMSVDIRSRVDGEAASVDPAECFERLLPGAFEQHRDLLGDAVRAYALPPLVVDVDGEGWTLSDDRGTVRVRAGVTDDAGVVVRMSAAQLDDLVNDQVTVVGMQTNGTLDQPVGRFDTLLDWWLLLRGALDARAPHVAGAIDLVDADGVPLALDRSFPADAPLEEMGDFLQRAGYLHIEGVFGEDEMAAVSLDMDRAAPTYTPDDGRSWWARNTDGEQLLVRMQYFDEVSPAVERLVHDERLLRLANLTGDGHVFGSMEDNRIEALFKPFGVVEGISDLPWHKDCALGRHSYDCCGMTVGISVTGADARSGQLRAVAGSHRALLWPSDHREDRSDLPAVELPTRTGDVTVHLSCTLHKSQPPIERERRVLYTGFRLPLRGTEAEREARERLRSIREDAPVKAPAARRAS